MMTIINIITIRGKFTIRKVIKLVIKLKVDTQTLNANLQVFERKDHKAFALFQNLFNPSMFIIWDFLILKIDFLIDKQVIYLGFLKEFLSIFF